MKKISIIIGIMLLALGVCVYKVHAALPGDEGLTLSPPLKEITINPGDTSTQTLKLTNPTSKLVELYPKVMDFSAKGETGEPGFSEGTGEDAKYSLAKWITLSQPKIALTPEQVVEYKYQITVPEGAEPGGHYGVVFFATEPPKPKEDTSSVALSSMVGGLVLVKVPGDVIEKASVEEFYTQKGLYFSGTVNFISRIKNEGNIHFKPKGEIKIKNIFGRSEDALPFNKTEGNVLPDSIRKFDNNWKLNWKKFGRYTAILDITYGTTMAKISAKASFWVIPIWLIVVIAVCVILVIIMFIRKNRKNRKNRSNQPPQNIPPRNQPPILR